MNGLDLDPIEHELTREVATALLALAQYKNVAPDTWIQFSTHFRVVAPHLVDTTAMTFIALDAGPTGTLQ